MTDADLHALLRDVADQPRRLTTTAAILLATFAWLAVTW